MLFVVLTRKSEVVMMEDEVKSWRGFCALGRVGGRWRQGAQPELAVNGKMVVK